MWPWSKFLLPQKWHDALCMVRSLDFSSCWRCWRSISLYLRTRYLPSFNSSLNDGNVGSSPPKWQITACFFSKKAFTYFALKLLRKSAWFVLGVPAPLHTLVQLVLLTLSRMRNAVPFVSVKLAAHNVFPLPFTPPGGERPRLLCFWR